MIGRTDVKTPVLPCSIPGYHTDAGRHTQQNLFAAVALFGLVLRGLWVAGIAVAIVAAVAAAICSAHVVRVKACGTACSLLCLCSLLIYLSCNALECFLKLLVLSLDSLDISTLEGFLKSVYLSLTS